MARQILSDLKVFMRAIKLENQDGDYLIGNCNMDVGLKDVVVRIVPAVEDEDHNEAIILNGMYNNEEFEDYMGCDPGEMPYYFYGKVNMDIRAPGTVWKFFPKRFGEHNVLIINQTQHKQDNKRISNPLEVKIFMRRKNLQRDAS